MAPKPASATVLAAGVDRNSRRFISSPPVDVSSRPPAFVPAGFSCSSKLVSLLGQSIRKIARDLARFVLVEQVRDHQIGEVGTVDAAGHIMARRDRRER